MKPDSFLIGLVLFSLFIVAGTLILQDIITNYDLNVTTDEYRGVYNITEDMYGLSQDMKEATIEGDLEGGDESWESMTKGSYSAVRMLRESFSLVGGIADAVAKEIGIPSIFIKSLMIILTIMIVFALIYLVFRFIPR